MIDESCKVPRENLDDGFNPCRKQVVENGELCQYAHMYDVMNERYDREDETSYLDWAKRDRITQSTPSQTVGEGKLYAQDAQGAEGYVKTSGTLDPTTHAEIPSSKAVADYAPIPLPISKGGTGGNTPYVTDAFNNSANFVMYDEQNARYNAAPMSALTGYLNGIYDNLRNVVNIPESSDLNTYLTPGVYACTVGSVVDTILNTPQSLHNVFRLTVSYIIGSSYYVVQKIEELPHSRTWVRMASGGSFNDWELLYPTPSVPDKFSYAVSPFPTGTWEGEMNINVVPVFATTMGKLTYVVARVYGSKRFNYTGSADTINLFSGLRPVEKYTNVFNSSTNIPLTLSVSGRSYTSGTYGFTPNGSTANLSLNNQIVSSVFNIGEFNISNNLECVFGEGTNTPGVSVTVNCMALMWNSPI